MFFLLSKIIWGIFTPLTFVFLLAGVGICFVHKLWGRRLLQITGVIAAAIGFLPIGYNMLVYLENTYEGSTIPQKVDGIIMLGGVIDLEASVARSQVQLNANPDRLIELAQLSQIYPQAKVVVSGGNGSVKDVDTDEGQQAEIFLKKLKVPTGKMLFERKSRNTFENMEFSKELAHPQAGENWLLITSAFHMPRSVAVFESNGWPVVPIQAGYITDGKYRYLPTFDVSGSYYKFQVAAREFVGIIAYTLTERIKTHVDKADNADLHSVVAVPATGGVGK